jgi:hypothetical protein
MRSDDRVLDGLPVDGGAESLASLMDALRVPGLEHELSDQAQSVAAFTAALGAAATVDRPRRGPVKSRRYRFALSLALSGAALVATSGLAYAGALPGAAQDTAKGVLAGLGVTVPGPNQHAGTHPDSRGNSAAAPGHAATTAGTGTDATGDTGSGKGKGAAISTLARTTTATGRDKGAIISTAASGGKSHAGNPPGQASAHHSTGTTDQGGTGTADGASGGNNSHGSSTAQAASGGHSSAGSGNAGEHPAAH